MSGVLKSRFLALGVSSMFIVSPCAYQEREFTLDEVRQRDGRDGRPLWATFRGGVHDLTTFRAIHPGGKFIEQAAGGDVEEFWNVWAYHYTSKKVDAYLKETRIGALRHCDAVVQKKIIEGTVNPYSSEPVRATQLFSVLSERPHSTETQPSVLIKSHFTPSEALYVRNHGPVPDLCEGDHTLSLEESEGSSGCTLSVQELYEKYPAVTITSVLQCAGNRTSEDIQYGGSEGNGFYGTMYEGIRSGMVGNGQWTGVRLKEVMEDIYPDQCQEELASSEDIWHVCFTGADQYQSSTPLSHVLQSRSDAMLVTDLNRSPLSRDHGYPLRILVPGLAGARNVKWLESISLSRGTMEGPWNDYYYRRADGSQIQSLPLQSVILAPEDTEEVSVASDGCVEIKGICYSGGVGTDIRTVELSTDGGNTWTAARLHREDVVKDDSRAFYGWLRFTGRVRIPTGARSICVCSRATDDAGVVQPQVSKKQRGYLYNGWSKVKIKFKQQE